MVEYCKKVIIDTGRDRSPTVLFGLVETYNDSIVVTTWDKINLKHNRRRFMKSKIVEIQDTDREFISGDTNGKRK